MGSKQAKVSYTTRATYRFPHSLHGRENKQHVTSVIATHHWPTLLPFPGLLWSFSARRVSPLGPQKAPGPS